MGRCSHRFGGISFHQAEVFESVCDNGGSCKMDIPEAYPRGTHADTVVIGPEDKVVQVGGNPLKDPAHRDGTGKIAAIMALQFRPGIHEQQPACGQYLVVGMAMHHFPVLCQDNRERRHVPATDSNTFHDPGQLLFNHPGLSQFHSRIVHGITQVAGTVYLLNFFRLFYHAHAHNSPYKLFRGFFFLLLWMDIQHIHQLNHVLAPVGRQKMNRASLPFLFADIISQVFPG